jgi:hypothetical protein
MKNILLSLAIFLMAINLLGYIGGARPFPKEDVDAISKGAYFIGTNLFFIIGFILLLFAFRINKKLNRRKDRQLVDDLLSNQNNTK